MRINMTVRVPAETLDATLAQLLIFLEEAEDTEAALSVYTELQRIQGEIERTKGRIQYLEQASALSSVNVTLIPDALARPVSIAGWRPQGTLRRAFELGRPIQGEQSRPLDFFSILADDVL